MRSRAKVQDAEGMQVESGHRQLDVGGLVAHMSLKTESCRCRGSNMPR